MKRIDFLGAPGVGKSTLANALIKHLRNEAIIDEQSARLRSVNNYLANNISIDSILARAVLKIPKIRNPYITSIEEKIIKVIFEEFVNEHEELFRVIDLAYKESEKNLYRKQYGYLSFNRKIKIFAVLMKYFKECGWVAFDESVSQKVYGIHPSDGVDTEITEKYFSAIPKPEILIHCYAKEETIVQRILKRKKTIPAHRGATMPEIQSKVEASKMIAKIGAEILMVRDSLIVEVNMDNSIESNVDFIKNKISGLL